ncbi:aspartate kinase [Tumebacillus sp. BK434]|uniref:aspartate kinase n=1 Tax=Tumebacillus sp. BK434 TaxID=2512169 RepID=UPI00104430DC|nr:aspartate kinase [Tumebacillus sp. BK434]TCP54732.1 aspartate kinase [Tumebacillus sp. BK434]
MALIVQKFGGTSLAGPEQIRQAACRVQETVRNGYEAVVVVSAMGHTTDQLLGLAGQLTDQPCRRELDMLLVTGEQVSAALLALALQALGVPSVSLNGAMAGIRTEDLHGEAQILSIDPLRIRAELQAGRVVIVTGFQGVNPAGDPTTLGRGGSDTSAVALAAALKAELCEICTDVDGVYTADPNVVPTARMIDRLSYEEMLELATGGAVVLHPRAVETAKANRVPVTVRSSFHAGAGTWIGETKEEAGR